MISMGAPLHAGRQVHRRPEDVIDVLVNADDGADHRPGGDADPRNPGGAVGLVALFQIAHEQQRRPGDVAGMIGRRLWNRIPDDVRRRIVGLALDVPELSPRELAVRFTETEKYFVSEASVYRLLKSLDLITSPAFIVIKAADEFRDKTTAINQLWQTDFTYLKVIGWGWMYLSTILDDYSRYIIAWKLCSTMKTRDVTDTLALALQASGCDQAHVVHKPRLLSDNGSSYVSGELAG